jgi:hypothetical protein
VTAGNHQLCIENYGNNIVEIDFEIVSGIAAKDYSELAKKKNLTPVELNVFFNIFNIIKL